MEHLINRRTALTILAGGCLSGCRRESPAAVSAGSAVAVSEGAVFREYVYRKTRWRVIFLEPGFRDLHLAAGGADGQPLRDFDRIRAAESATGRRVDMMMNAGMFDEDGRPCGLCIQEGKEIAPLNLRSGAGNFYLMPNGVFFTGSEGPGIVESSAWPGAAKGRISCATQSGPLLLQHGSRHGQLREFSDNVNIRNGVGVTAGGGIALAISVDKVNFFDMAMFFLEVLDCPDALYLDGVVSALDVPAAGLRSSAAGLGPVLVVRRPV